MRSHQQATAVRSRCSCLVLSSAPGWTPEGRPSTLLLVHHTARDHRHGVAHGTGGRRRASITSRVPRSSSTASMPYLPPSVRRRSHYELSWRPRRMTAAGQRRRTRGCAPLSTPRGADRDHHGGAVSIRDVSAEALCARLCTSRFRGNQRKGKFVKWFRDVISAGAWGVLLQPACSPRWRGWSGGADGGHAGGRRGARPGAGCGVARDAARGSCARRSSSGLGVPTAFNRAGEGPRAGRGELPWVSGEVVLNVKAGSLPPWGNGLGARAAAAAVPGCRLACGYAAMAW